MTLKHSIVSKIHKVKTKRQVCHIGKTVKDSCTNKQVNFLEVFRQGTSPRAEQAFMALFQVLSSDWLTANALVDKIHFAVEPQPLRCILSFPFLILQTIDTLSTIYCA